MHKKQFLKYFFIAVIAVAYGCNTKNTIDKDRQRINRVCDEMMEHFKSGKVIEISNLLKENSSLIGQSAIDTLRKQMTTQFETGSFSKYGKVVSFDLVREINIQNFVARRIYILRCEHFFFTVSFSLYNSIKGWEITGFKYDEDSSILN